VVIVFYPLVGRRTAKWFKRLYRRLPSNEAVII